MADKKPRKKKTKTVSDFLLGVIERVAKDETRRDNQLRSYAGRAFVGIVGSDESQKEQIKTFLRVKTESNAPAYAIVIEDIKNDFWANEVFTLSGTTYRDLWDKAEPVLNSIVNGERDIVVLGHVSDWEYFDATGDLIKSLSELSEKQELEIETEHLIWVPPKGASEVSDDYELSKRVLGFDSIESLVDTADSGNIEQMISSLIGLYSEAYGGKIDELGITALHTLSGQLNDLIEHEYLVIQNHETKESEIKAVDIIGKKSRTGNVSEITISLDVSDNILDKNIGEPFGRDDLKTSGYNFGSKQAYVVSKESLGQYCGQDIHIVRLDVSKYSGTDIDSKDSSETLESVPESV